MPDAIQVNYSIRFPGGLTLSEAQRLPIEAYDTVEVVVAANTNRTIQVQPAPVSQVRFLLIKSDTYDPHLTYQVRGPEDDAGGPIVLDGIQVFSTAGMLSLLPESPVDVIVNNQSAADKTIQILVGRNAVAP